MLSSIWQPHIQFGREQVRTEDYVAKGHLVVLDTVLMTKVLAINVKKQICSASLDAVKYLLKT